MFTGRSQSQRGRGSNEAYGVDGVFGFYDDLTINTHWARTQTEGLTGNDTSYRGHVNYAGDRYGLQLEHLLVGNDFNPEVGFVPGAICGATLVNLGLAHVLNRLRLCVAL